MCRQPSLFSTDSLVEKSVTLRKTLDNIQLHSMLPTTAFTSAAQSDKLVLALFSLSLGTVGVTGSFSGREIERLREMGVVGVLLLCEHYAYG